MSKGDGNKDETPIQFYIPRISSRGRAPIPLNQPNWKYAPDYAAPPRIGDWLFSSLFAVMAFVVIYLGITEINGSYKWLFFIIGITFLYFSALMTVVRLMKYRRYTRNLPNEETREKLKKKQPKRRKDYR